jgi:ribonucleoside-triphosphate reductase
MKTVIKRDNTKKDFSKQKIANAILKAAEEHRYDILKEDVRSIADDIEKALDELGKSAATVEEIQDLVIKFLKVKGHQVLAKKYHEYREERTKAREMKTSLMNSIEKIGVETDRDNANVGNNFSAKLLRIASEANK